MSTEEPLDAAAFPARESDVDRVAELLADADAVLVGVGSGMSAAAGYDYYYGDAGFEANFGDFHDCLLYTSDAADD